MKVSAIIFFGVLFWQASAFAGNLETVISPPAKKSYSGQMIKFSVYIHYTGKESIFINLPFQLTCRLVAEEEIFELEAHAVHPFPETPVILEKNDFVKARYALTVPHGLEGPVRMELQEFEAAEVMFAVAKNEKTKVEAADADVSDTVEDGVSLESLFTLYQPYLVNIAAYEPMCFLVGADPEKSKFQFSFKYQFFNADNPLADAYPWVKGLHFGYTQTSFWDLASDSTPFKDTSYKPEFFFISSNIGSRFSWMEGLFLQTGLQHESNGRGGDLSRSTNYLYIKPISILYSESSRYGFQFSPKIWSYLRNDDDTNPDLEEYRGFFDLEMKFGKADSFVLGSNLRWADKGPSIQLDYTYPLHRLTSRNFDLYFQIQYVNALAESLIDYEDREESLRLGFAIVR